ncbi:hypothetical protein GCM10009856_55390 [Mycolicibacterium llatzerense]
MFPPSRQARATAVRGGGPDLRRASGVRRGVSPLPKDKYLSAIGIAINRWFLHSGTADAAERSLSAITVAACDW